MNYVDSFTQASVFGSLLKKPGNFRCADCDSQAPRWASVSFGTLVCIRCSGFHRKLGTHITKVRSLQLDRWTTELLDLYKNMSNEMLNKYWEQNLPKGYKRPIECTSDESVWKFVQEKYVKKQFAPEDMLDPVSLYKQKKKAEEEKPVVPEVAKVATTLLQHQRRQKSVSSFKVSMVRGDKETTELDGENSPVIKVASDGVGEVAEESRKEGGISPNRTKTCKSKVPKVFAVGVNAFTYLNGGGYRSMAAIPKIGKNTNKAVLMNKTKIK